MTDRWAELKALFAEGAALPASERPAYVDTVRRRDPALGEELAALLDSHEHAASFLEDSPAHVLLDAEASRPGSVLPGARLGDYTVLDFLGAGGMGEVYRARDPRLGRDVAIKTLPARAASAEWQARLVREASAAAALSHPHICTIYDIAEHEGRIFFAMEYVEGVTLDDHLRGGARPAAEVIDIGRQIADALEAAADRGIVHRDLKTANVMLTPRGQVKVLDFGLAKQVTAATPGAALTRSGAVMGTLPYMSPEQLRGRGADARSDLFALGVILYELLTGRRPFAGATDGELAGAILHATPAPIPPRDDQTAALAPIIARLLEKDPDARVQTAAEVRTSLAALQQPPSSPAGRSRRNAAARRWPIAAAGALLALLLGVWAWQERRPPSSEASSSRPSLVLPPARVFGADEVAYLAEAVPATLSTYLAQVPGLDTRVPPTLADVALVDGDMQRLAAAYGVSHYVLTSVTAQGERLVLGAQLVNPATRNVTWSAEYEGTRDSYLDMLREAAGAIQRALVDPSGSQPAIAPRADSAAELALRRGEYHARRYNALHRPDDYQAARDAFERALALDPALAAAAANLAGLANTRYEAGQAEASESRSEVRHWAQRAVAIDPRSGPAWAALAAAALGEEAPDTAALLEYALKGATFGPRCSECQATLSNALIATTLALSTIPLVEARRLDPLDLTAGTNTAMEMFLQNRTRDALRVMEEMQQLEPGSPFAIMQQALILADLGRVDEAQRLLPVVRREVRAQRLVASGLPLAEQAVARTAGDGATADAALKQLIAQIRSPSTSMWERLMLLMLTAPSLARAGRTETLIGFLEQGLDAGIAAPYDWLTTDARFAVLRQHPRYARLAAAARAGFDGMRDILDRARRRGELPAYLAEATRQLNATVP